MITDELLQLHDELEVEATPRPWESSTRTRPGYGKIIFWSPRPHLEIILDRVSDSKYLTFIRNLGPELVAEVRNLRKRVGELEVIIAELQKKRE